MKRKSMAFLLAACMLLSLFPENPRSTERAARAAEPRKNNKGASGQDGLRISWDINWENDAPTEPAENAEYFDVEGVRGGNILWDTVCSIMNGEEVVSADALHVYKWDEDASQYVASTEDVTVNACGIGDKLVQFTFASRGRYHVCLGENAAHKDSDDEANENGDGCIKFSVDYPEIAFYKTEELSESGIIKGDSPIEYNAGDSWYMLVNQNEGINIEDVSFKFLNGTPEILFDIQTVEENKKYKITANAAIGMNDGPAIRVSCSASDVNDTENIWETDAYLYLSMEEAVEKRGLLATDWSYWDEEQEKEMLDNDLNGFEALKSSALESRLCFKYNDGKHIEENEYGTMLTSDSIPAKDIKIYVKGENGKLTILTADSVTYKQSEEMPEFIDFSFKNCGQYIVCYAPDEGAVSYVVLDVGYPQVGFYTDSQCSEDGLIRGEASYSSKNRTFYYVIRKDEELDEEGNPQMHPVIVQEPEFDTGDKATVEKQNDMVYKIVVNPGVTEDFDIIARNCMLKWDENPEEKPWEEYAEMHLSYETVTEATPSPTPETSPAPVPTAKVTPTAVPTAKPTAAPTTKPTSPPTVKKVTIKKVKSPSKKKIEVSWKKISKVSGYQVQAGLDKKFKKSKKTVTIKGESKTKAFIKNVKQKKWYYVRVRAYKAVGGKKTYGKWSSVKKVKVK